jgi:hypothetical protein
MPEPADIVPALLTAAQLTVSDTELATFVRDYPLVRKGADALYLLDLGADEPATRFDPLDFYPTGKDA